MNKFLFLLTTICFSLVVTAQTDSALANLTKAQPDQLGGQLMLTPEVSLYDADMQTIDMNRFFELSQSGKFIPEAYIDDAENLKALVLKPATKEEIMELRKKMGRGKPHKKNNNLNIGKEAPAFTLTDLEGKTYSNEELVGKVVVFNFWFIKCKPCVVEIPELNEVVHKYKTHQDVVFIAIALDSPEKIHTFLEEHPFEYNIVPNGMETSSSFWVSAYPTHIVIGRDGKIAYRTSGLGPTTVSDLDAKIEALL